MLPYLDTCVIKKELPCDAIGNVEYEVIYSGSCDYHVGSSGKTTLSDGVLVTSPVVFIEDTTILLEDAMLVEVKTAYNKSIVGTIENFIVIDDESLKIKGTKIWLILAN